MWMISTSFVLLQLSTSRGREFFGAWGNLSMQWGAALIISDRSPTHCVDESPAGYSWAGCSPAEPACASPAGDHHAKTGSHGETKNRTTGKFKTTTVKDVSGQCVKDVSGLDTKQKARVLGTPQ